MTRMTLWEGALMIAKGLCADSDWSLYYNGEAEYFANALACDKRVRLFKSDGMRWRELQWEERQRGYPECYAKRIYISKFDARLWLWRACRRQEFRKRRQGIDLPYYGWETRLQRAFRKFRDMFR